ncbi:MAG: MFS transporter [Smithella sp.]
MPDTPKLLSREFIVLCLILVAAFANVSVFYSFYHYLGTIGIPLEWRGFIVGLEPMAAFMLRLFVIPWISTRNAVSILLISLVLIVIVSCSYLWALTVPAMIMLRIVHGTAFVLLTSAVIALIVQFIPREKSGQGFSIITISTMVPYAVIPTVTETLLPYVQSEADIYSGVSIFSVISILLLVLLKKRLKRVLGKLDEALGRRPRLEEIKENFKQIPVVLLLTCAFLVYLAHATVFYFTKDLALESSIGNLGSFFTISMLTMIVVRLAGSSIFDKTNKLYVFLASLALLILCLVLLSHAGSRFYFYLLAGLYGVCMGIILPLLNALLFTASPPPLRGLNTNLTLFTMDAGYFIMPYTGGLIIAVGCKFNILFYLAAAFILFSLLFVLLLIRFQRKIKNNRIH